jgi:hypothetical protein
MSRAPDEAAHLLSGVAVHAPNGEPMELPGLDERGAMSWPMSR